jgi:nitroimidazol reductase NimA-like FMN-containing flavoprotein (pyridoxamine 5'-phosphate oxidase superfamily)
LRAIRRKEKSITDRAEMVSILENTEYIMIAMCSNNEPYLSTLSHGYDKDQHCIYFHCAREGKKVDILNENNIVWGQVLIDKGYVRGACDHLYSTVQIKGRVSFIEDLSEKKHALSVMIESLDPNPQEIMEKQLTEKAVTNIMIGRIDIDYMSGKKSEKVIVSQ